MLRALKDVFTDGFLIPKLCSVPTGGTDGDVPRRCFRFVELLLASPDTSIGAAAVFQVIEPLLDEERLLVVSFPKMEAEALAVAVDTIDPDRLSPDATHALQPHLGKALQHGVVRSGPPYPAGNLSERR